MPRAQNSRAKSLSASQFQPIANRNGFQLSMPTHCWSVDVHNRYLALQWSSAPRRLHAFSVGWGALHFLQQHFIPSVTIVTEERRKL
ncbi:hypothetical protein EVAR_22038_1 [Eumeta japonica]|uniref:Uncharacterized protein n=1 Tax=Eumeta variegata TaxID=151549 RepID=A0A4C1UTW3_EUMVA|nr:hypothetical protein EVAR_22038_1 [Eumeta japonica]